MYGFTLITPDNIRHQILVAKAGAGISISRDDEGRLVLDTEGGVGGATELSDLTDVILVDPQEGDVLTYDAEFGVWTNRAPTAGGSVDPLVLSAVASVTATAGKTKLYGRTLANGPVVPWTQPDIGRAYPLQPSLGKKLVYRLQPTTGGFTNSQVGVGTNVVVIGSSETKYFVGDTNASALPNTNYPPMSMMTRARFQSVGANTACGLYSYDQNWQLGDTAPVGGFYHCYRFGFQDLYSTSRLCVGPRVPDVHLTADVGTDANGCIANLIKDAADTNLFVYSRDTGGSGIKTDLGIPHSALSSSSFFVGDGVFEWEVFVAPQGTVAYYRLTNVVSGTVLAEGQQSLVGYNRNYRYRFFCEAGTGPNTALGAPAIMIMLIYGERNF